jgi:hypothetical protein
MSNLKEESHHERNYNSHYRWRFGSHHIVRYYLEAAQEDIRVGESNDSLAERNPGLMCYGTAGRYED